MTYLYTVFFEFQSGIYIRQVTAIDEQEAMRNWAVQLDHEKIQGLGQRRKQHLIEKIAEVTAVDARGVKKRVGIWTFIRR